MKRLLLLRHGKSDWGQQGQDDFERPLAKRGRKASKLIAEWLATHDRVPTHVLVSAALRTRQTWDLVQEALDSDAAAEVMQELYLAAPGTLLAHIEAIPDTTDIAMVVGHNPGTEELARMLAGPDPEPDAMRDLMRGFPTAGLAVFTLAGDSWSRLSADGARLETFVRPRELD